MRLASNKNGRLFLEEAQDWFANADSAVFFGDVKTIAIRAVAEYLANQKGFTLYKLLYPKKWLKKSLKKKKWIP